jgi:hypothetical protein
VAGHQEGRRVPRGVQHRVGIFEGGRHRLFDEDRLAGSERGHDGIAMVVLSGRDADRVDVGIGDQVPVIVVVARHPETGRDLGRPFAGARRDSDDFGVANRAVRVEVTLPELPETDDADVHLCPGHSSLPITADFPRTVESGGYPLNPDIVMPWTK